MKKQLLFFTIFSLVIISAQPVHALTFKERVQKLQDQAIAVAKKGGAKSKELWHKIDFLGNAIRAENKARRTLTECMEKNCSGLFRRGFNDTYSECHSRACTDCRSQNCANEFKQLQKTKDQTLVAILKLDAILLGTVGAVALAGTGVAISLPQKQRLGVEVEGPPGTEVDLPPNLRQTPPIKPPYLRGAPIGGWQTSQTYEMPNGN